MLKILLTVSACFSLIQTDDFAGRILSDSYATPDEFPYAVSIKVRGQHTCGGAIIDYRWVLTAASCFARSEVRSPNQILVMAGTIDLNGMGGSLHSVDKLFVHQNYTKQFQADVQGDIALLRLAKRFSYDSNIQPIKLGTVYDGAKAVVVGWGSESNEYPVASQILKSVKMMVIPGDAACQTDATRVCAAAQTGTGTCMGDSGAPLVDVDSGKLLGIFSLGVQRGCGLGLADIFTKVEPYAKWIDYVKTI